jgi:hypothetical protein
MTCLTFRKNGGKFRGSTNQSLGLWQSECAFSCLGMWGRSLGLWQIMFHCMKIEVDDLRQFSKNIENDDSPPQV